MASHYDVIVIGIGSMGSAACHALTSRGLRVLGLEQHSIPHSYGSHHGHTRMIRLAYYEHPDYVPLLRRAYACWHEQERLTGQRLLHVTGGIYMGPLESRLVSGALASCREHSIDHDLLSPAELAERYPMFRPPAGYHALVERNAGFVFPELAVGAYARLALTAGADLRGHCNVLRWEARDKSICVATSQGDFTADRLVVTAGAWSAELLREIGVPLHVTRQTLAWFWPRNPELFALGKFPVWFMETEDGHGHYGFPMIPESLGFKMALHKPDQIVDPSSVDRSFRESDVAGLRRFLHEHVPAAAGPLLATSTCLYTHSPDSHFIIDTWPSDPRITFACGFSGHGFKFAGVIGEILADLAMTGQCSLPMDFLRLARFRAQ